MINFTIITCTLNAESVLKRTLDSILYQTWDGINHIVMDGMSSDNTLQMVQQYKADIEQMYKNKRHVTIISEKDNGLYDAMNKALQMAKPDYVLFLNAGDTLHNQNTLHDIVDCISREIENSTADTLPGVLYGDTNVVDASNHYVGKRIHQPPEELTWRSFQNGMLVCHQAFYARTDIARKCAYDLKYRFSADVDWCIRVMKETEKMKLKLLNTNMVVCNFLAGGLSLKNHKESLHERFLIMVKHYGVFTTVWKHIQMTRNALVATKKDDITF